MLRMNEKLQTIQDDCIFQRILMCKFQDEDFSKRAKVSNINWIKCYQRLIWIL